MHIRGTNDMCNATYESMCVDFHSKMAISLVDISIELASSVGESAVTSNWRSWVQALV